MIEMDVVNDGEKGDGHGNQKEEKECPVILFQGSPGL